MSEQKELEKLVNKMIDRHGEKDAIEIIKARGIGRFQTRQNYPYGVFVFCNSPEYGVMVGKR